MVLAEPVGLVITVAHLEAVGQALLGKGMLVVVVLLELGQTHPKLLVVAEEVRVVPVMLVLILMVALELMVLRGQMELHTLAVEAVALELRAVLVGLVAVVMVVRGALLLLMQPLILVAAVAVAVIQALLGLLAVPA